jgi:hypothetical protein
MRLLVVVDGGGTLVYEEAAPNGILSLNGEVILDEAQDPLADMATQFINDTRRRVVDDRFVRLSVAVTRSLASIRRAES